MPVRIFSKIYVDSKDIDLKRNVVRVYYTYKKQSYNVFCCEFSIEDFERASNGNLVITKTGKYVTKESLTIKRVAIILLCVMVSFLYKEQLGELCNSTVYPATAILNCIFIIPLIGLLICFGIINMD